MDSLAKTGFIMQAIPILLIVAVGIYRLIRILFHVEQKANGEDKV